MEMSRQKATLLLNKHVLKSLNVFFMCCTSTFLISCAQPKSTSTVFDSNDTASAKCAGESVQYVKNRFIVQWEDGRVTVEHAENAEVFKEDFIAPNLEQIKKVEYDQKVHVSDVITASEVSSMAGDTWGLDRIKASSAWTQGFKGQNVTVAVVDTAVDINHVQLKPRLVINDAEANGKAGVDDDGNGFIDDVNGWDFVNNKPNPTPNPDPTKDHGTHVAGIILADPTTGSMSGVAPEARLLPVSFLGNDGSGSLGDAVVAIQFAAQRGAKVINASWGGEYCSEALKNSINALGAKNVLFAVASGNEGIDFDTTGNYVYPAVYNFAHTITVAASSANDYLTGFSNRSFGLVHLAAPGVNIFSTVRGGYQYLTGTSMATPFVSGAAAVLWSARPNATASQIRQALISGVDVTPGKEMKVLSQGRLNLEKPLAEIRRLVP